MEKYLQGFLEDIGSPGPVATFLEEIILITLSFFVF